MSPFPLLVAATWVLVGLLPRDPTVQVAAVGIVTTFITTAGVLLVALVNNRKERLDAADAGIMASMRERLALRDEQLQDCRDDRITLQHRLDVALEEIEEKTMLVRHLRTELEQARST